jgi:hypothetical protein
MVRRPKIDCVLAANSPNELPSFGRMLANAHMAKLMPQENLSLSIPLM